MNACTGRTAASQFTSPRHCDCRGAPGGTYRSRGGLFAEEAVELLRTFYVAGNPAGMPLRLLFLFPTSSAHSNAAESLRLRSYLLPAAMRQCRKTASALCALARRFRHMNAFLHPLAAHLLQPCYSTWYSTS
jgi:hypothetical protein